MFDIFSMRYGCRPPWLWAVALASFAAVVLIASLPAQADVSWSTSSGDWANAANWGGILPTGSDDAYIANGGTATVTSPNDVCGQLNLGNANGSGTIQISAGMLATNSIAFVGDAGMGSVVQSGGSLLVSPGCGLTLANTLGSSGTYTLTGGSVAGQCLLVGNAGAAMFTQSGGTNNASGWFIMAAQADSTASYNLSGPSLLLTSELTVGDCGMATFYQSGGNVTNDQGVLVLGNFSGSSGTYNLVAGQLSSPWGEVLNQNEGTGVFMQSGGTNSIAGGQGLILSMGAGGSGTYSLSGSGLLTAAAEFVGDSGTGTVTQSGGTNSIAGALYLAGGYIWDNPSACGTYNLSGSGLLSAWNESVGYSAGTGTFLQSGGTNNAGCLSLAVYKETTGRYDLNGGLLILSSLDAGAGSATFNFSGGTLRASGDFSTSLPMTLGTSGGGATFDSAGFAVTLSGLLSGPGSLTKVGSGLLTLATANTFSGTTLVSGGTLALASGLALQYSTLDTTDSGIVSFTSQSATTLGGLSGGGKLRLTVPLSVGNNNASTTFSGMLQGGGGLLKVGSGVLALSGSNTYNGRTTIAQGKLAVNGWLGSPLLRISGGATLGGTGTIGGQTTLVGGNSPATQGTLDLVDGAAGTMTFADSNPAHTALMIGGMSAATPSVLNFEVGSTADLVLVTSGKLMINLGGGIINIIPLDGFHPGIYELFDFSAGQATGLDRLIPGETTVTIGTNTYGLSLRSTPTSEELVVTPEPSALVLLGAAAIGLVGSTMWRRRAVRRTARPAAFDYLDAHRS